MVALTANATKGDRETGLRRGRSDYAAKPVNWAALGRTFVLLREDDRESLG